MSACQHSLSICADCDGLVVTEWTLLGAADEVEMPFGLARNVQVFVSPLAEPCDKKPRPTA